MMRKLINKILQSPIQLIAAYDRLLGSLRPGWEGRVRSACIETLMATPLELHHKGLSLRFLAPNPLTVFRAHSFSTKEPETLEWIDSFNGDGVLWDIGANVGLYSIYAAKRHPNIKVYAFEPSVLNLELLVRNIALNGLEEQITVVPVALSDKSGPDWFRLGNLDRGGALSAFSVTYGHDGNEIAAELSFKTFGLSIDDVAQKWEIPTPRHVKIDVDGIEHVILRGGTETLRQSNVESMLIEINDDFSTQRQEANRLMTEFGFHLSQKRHGSAFDDAQSKFARTFNNIWVKNSA